MQTPTLLGLLVIALMLGIVIYLQYSKVSRKDRAARTDSLKNDVREFAHELNNSLLVAMSNLELLADSLDKNDEQRTLVADSLSACREISELTGRFSAQFQNVEE